MVHSVHGRSRPAAVLCAWMMSKGVGKVSLADALTATQACFGQPYAQPNFGFVAQLLEYGAFHSPVGIVCVRVCRICTIACYGWMRQLSLLFGSAD
jgi:hypothetical protein